MQGRTRLPSCWLLLWLLAGHAGADPTGHLFYIKNKTLYVNTLATGAERRLPCEDEVQEIYASPGPDATALVFTTPKGSGEGREVHTKGFALRPPYKTWEPLMLPATQYGHPDVTWTPDGSKAFLAGDKQYILYTPATGRATIDVFPAQTASRDGSVVASATGKEIRARWIRNGQEKTLFSVKNPQPLFDALRAAKYPQRVKDVMNDDPELWHDPKNWAIGNPAMMPDGKRVFFAANMGLGMGAQGNTTFCFFVANVETGKVVVLSKLGAFFGRVSEWNEVSPDGRNLLFISSIHSSAADNASGLHVVDLLTQAHRELLDGDPIHKADTNLVAGQCWSPDSRYVAVSVVYYNVEQIIKNNKEPGDQEYTLYIKEAATGKTIRRIPGAQQPAWTR